MTSEVKQGYKQTEIGVIPEDWEVKELGELFSFSNGVNADKSAYGKGYRFINVLEPISYSHLYGSEIPGRVTLPKAVASSYFIKKGDVVFNRTSETDTELGLAAVYMGVEEVVFGGFVIRGRSIDDSFDAVYCGYALRAENIRAQIISKAQGAVRANIGQDNLRRVFMPVPNKAEQKAIAEVLSDADALIESLEQLIVKKRQIKQGVMQELLTGKKRLPGFSGEWEVKRLGDISEMESGGTPSTSVTEYYNGDIPWVSITDMTSAGKFIMNTDRCLSTSGLANSNARLFRKGTVLYAMYASLGECCIAGVTLSSSQAILGIWTKDCLHCEFLYYYLFSLKGIVKLMGQQGTQANLNKGMVQAFVLSLPPTFDEQVAIASVLSDMDAEIAALESKLEKACQLKQGMMHNLLTGKIRLV